MPKFSLMVATFPFGGTESFRSRNWLIRTAVKIHQDSRFAHVHNMDIDDTPIPMSRNRVMKEALARNCDLVLMIDSDVHPDMYLGMDAQIKPFWDSSLEFMFKHAGPGVVAAPYCGPPPHENVYIFRWANQESNQPNPDLRLEQYTREEAAVRVGFERVAALPTGLILIDTRVLKYLKPPYFRYEYTDEQETDKASTEDVVFTRNLDLAGVPQYVNWDAWCGHVKRKTVGKPIILTSDSVQDSYRTALERNIRSGERLLDVGNAPDGHRFKQTPNLEATPCSPGPKPKPRPSRKAG
jgi:hypothetical protein